MKMNRVSPQDCPPLPRPTSNPHTAAHDFLHWRLLPSLPQDPTKLVPNGSSGKGRRRTNPQLSPLSHRLRTRSPRQLLTGDPLHTEPPRIMRFVELRQPRSSTSPTVGACLVLAPGLCLFPENPALLEAQHPTSTPNQSPLVAISTTLMQRTAGPHPRHMRPKTQSTPGLSFLGRRNIARPMDPSQT